QVAGAIVLAGLILSGLALFARNFPRAEGDERDVLVLGAAGGAMLPIAVAAFLVSPMVMDHFSMRYLAAITYFAPFTLAPLAARVSAPRVGAALAPAMVAAAICGWLGYGRFVDGARVRREPGRADDERALLAALAERGVTAAMADYWVSYRLAF